MFEQINYTNIIIDQYLEPSLKCNENLNQSFANLLFLTQESSEEEEGGTFTRESHHLSFQSHFNHLGAEDY